MSSLLIQRGGELEKRKNVCDFKLNDFSKQLANKFPNNIMEKVQFS